MSKKSDFSSPIATWRNRLLTSGFILFTFITCNGEDSAAASNSAKRWPAFLGTGASAVDPGSIPQTWSATENIAWESKLPGQGQSSPVIWGGIVFSTGIDGAMKNDCHVTGTDLETGKILWDYKTPSSQPVRSNYFQSRSAPTPAVDANRVYAFFETGNLVGLTHTGKKVWERSLTEDYGEFEVRIGLAASLAQTEKAVIVLIDHEGPSYLLAVDKTNGETLWKTERFSRSSYASPAVLNIGGSPQIVCSSSGSIDGYDPETGEQLWTQEDVGGNRACTPRLFRGNCFLVGASPGMHNQRLADAKKTNFAMEIEKSDAGFQPNIMWKTEKAMPSFGSPIVYQGLAYWINKVGVVYCFDAITGDSVYTQRSQQSTCWATPFAIGDRIYLFGQRGTTTVIAAGPEYKVIAENKLFEAPERSSRGRRSNEDNEKSAQVTSGEQTPPRGATTGRESTKANTANKNEQKTDTTESAAPMTEANSQRESRDSGSGRSGSDSSRSRSGGSRTDSGAARFAEEVQYGYAIVDGSIVVRTGSRLFCIRASSTQATPAVSGLDQSSPNTVSSSNSSVEAESLKKEGAIK